MPRDGPDELVIFFSFSCIIIFIDLEFMPVPHIVQSARRNYSQDLAGEKRFILNYSHVIVYVSFYVLLFRFRSFLVFKLIY